MGNSSSAHGRLLKAVANDDDTFIKQIVLGTDEHERYKLLGAKAGWGSRGSKTALHLCAKEGKCRVLAALLLPLVTAVTAEIDAGSYPGRASHLLSRLVNKQQRAGRTPFLSACYYGQWQCAQQLLEAGSNVFAVDMDGNDALHLAAVSSRAEVVEQLLAIADHQAITSRLASIVNLSGFTPLHYAAWVGCAEAAQQLLAADVDQLQSSWGEYDRWLVVPLCSTALHVAALQLRPSVCIVLLQHYVLQLQDWLPGDPMPVDPRTRCDCFHMLSCRMYVALTLLLLYEGQLPAVYCDVAIAMKPVLNIQHLLKLSTVLLPGTTGSTARVRLHTMQHFGRV